MSSKHYQITKGKELPKSGRRYGKLIDLAQMDVNDSFTFPNVDEKRVQSMIDAFGKKNGASFTISVSETVATCWRVA